MNDPRKKDDKLVHVFRCMIDPRDPMTWIVLISLICSAGVGFMYLYKTEPRMEAQDKWCQEHQLKTSKVVGAIGVFCLDDERRLVVPE
jgi:hypothetical protein